MTIKERVKNIVHSKWDAFDFHNKGHANVEKMILMAYWIGREEATKRVSDMYSDHLKKQRDRANNCRYHKLAYNIIGPEKYLYTMDYAGEMTKEFGDDPADI